MANRSVLVFVVFLIHALAEAWHMSPDEVYSVIKECGALDGYIVPYYDVLHSFGSEYLVDDITECVKERGGVL